MNGDATAGARPPLYTERGGAGEPILVLLHGLGASAAVWDGVLEFVRADWPGRWLAPDLRGHGRSSHAAPYGYGMHAADVAALLDPLDEVVVLGHSMGGVVGLALATGWFGVTVRSLVAFGVKPDFDADDVVRLHGVGRAPLRWFDTREEAIARQIAVAGLRGIVGPENPIGSTGIVESSGKFRIATDPRANFAVGPPIEPLLAASQAPLYLGVGDRDPLVAVDATLAVQASAHIFPGRGHNVQVESPREVWDFARPRLMG